MSTNKFENATFDLDVILNRIKKFVGSNKDIVVASELGVSRSNIPTWRKRGTLPYKELVLWAFNKDVSLDWLFYGNPQAMIDDSFDEADDDLSEHQSVSNTKPTERVYGALQLVTEVQSKLGIEFTKDQIQILMGYTIDHCPSKEGLTVFVKAAFEMVGKPLDDVKR